MSAWDAACHALQELANDYGVRLHRSRHSTGETVMVCAELRHDGELLAWIHATTDAGCHVSISRASMTGAWSAWASMTRSDLSTTRPEAAHAASEDA